MRELNKQEQMALDFLTTGIVVQEMKVNVMSAAIVYGPTMGDAMLQSMMQQERNLLYRMFAAKANLEALTQPPPTIMVPKDKIAPGSPLWARSLGEALTGQAEPGLRIEEAPEVNKPTLEYVACNAHSETGYQETCPEWGTRLNEKKTAKTE